MKIICIGRNYTDHIKELKNEKTENPVVFLKPDSAVLPPKQPFYIPDFSGNIHYEAEVLVKINKIGKHIDKVFAHTYYDEVSLGIDFTARDLQDELRKKGLPWEKCKGFDGSALIGEWRSKNRFKDIDHIDFHMDKNGDTVQRANTSLMLWKTDEIIAYVSTFFTLKKGDIIFTGTPAGVGKVAPGDRLEGYLENRKIFAVNVK